MKRAGYTFTIPYAEVWKAVLDDGTAYPCIYAAMESKDWRFWDDGLEHLYKGLTLSDASVRYCGTHYYDAPMSYDETGHVIWGPADGYSRTALAEPGVCTYYLSAKRSGEVGAYEDHLELTCEYGEPWSIVIDLKEAADA